MLTEIPLIAFTPFEYVLYTLLILIIYITRSNIFSLRHRSNLYDKFPEILHKKINVFSYAPHCNIIIFQIWLHFYYNFVTNKKKSTFCQIKKTRRLASPALGRRQR